MADSRFFRTQRGGQTVILDRETQMLYNEQGQIFDPITRQWRDDPSRKEQKQPNKLEQLGYVAAGPAAYAAGQALANNTGGMFGLGAEAAVNSSPAGVSGVGPVASGQTYGTSLAASGAPEAPTIVNGSTAGTTTTATGGSGSGILGANGATLGSAGVGLAGAGVGAYYGYAANQAYGHLKSKDPEKRKRGTMETALLATGPFLGWASPLVSPIDEFLGSGKDKDQQSRDFYRKRSEEIGATKDYKVTLVDGTQVDLGLDGGATYKGKDGKELHAYDLDFSDPRAAQVAADLDPLAAILSGGNEKGRNDVASQFGKAALTSGDPRANALKFYADHGLGDAATVIQTLDDLVSRGKLSQEQRDIFANSANILFSGQGAAPQASQMQTLPNRTPTNPAVPQQVAGAGGMASLGATGRKPKQQGGMTYL